MAMIEQLFSRFKENLWRQELICYPNIKLLPLQGLLNAVDVIPQSEEGFLMMGDMVQSLEKMVLGLYDKAVTS